MLERNGDFARGLPAQLDAALRAARSGHHVSFESLRAAVCIYIDELVGAGQSDAEVRVQLVAVFLTVSDETRVEPVAWNEALIDELIALCRGRAALNDRGDH